ncbi:hypothetical protein JMJ35_010682 [Cladonia borealis]|uniref:NACHT-NTPase and P-loop NTPases N-terminal domain-containing protein n=1 Tax=Cladonia borealis TaxID=184061 RepID=A0AA39UX74_9LECA|nr:hypothetical protein JMJ35_010682 [Cladonia borealis]
MSGAEAIAILGIISSVISIVDGTKQVYDAASNTNGLPEAFREVATRLPMVRDILDSAKRHIEEGSTNEGSYEAAKNVVEDCQARAQKLEKIFQDVIPADGASRAGRYISAVKTVGKGNRVEILMEGILKDLQLLAIKHGMITKTDTREKELVKAIEELAASQTSFIATHSGSSAINQAQGNQFNNPGSGHINQAQSMNSGYNVPNDQAQSCLRALFQALQTDPRLDRNSLIHRKETRVEHTCTWITSNQDYKSWLHSHPQLLWLSGGPGKGKTMMSIFLAEELERFTDDMPDAVSLEFFCDNKNNKRNTADSVIQGLVFQLLHKRPELSNHILPTFAIQQASLFTGSSFESLWSIFEKMTCDPMLRTIYCVLDGLDECEKPSLEVLLRHFKALLSKNTSDTSSCCLNLIAVSRDLPNIIPKLLSGFPRIRLDGDADIEVNQDITRFIDAKLDYIFSVEEYPQATRVRVKNVFHERSQGTFLWIGIAAKTLEGCNAIEVEEVLERLPPGLDELYDRMLLDIKVNHQQVAASILRWVVMAVRPLTLSELSAIIEPTVEPPTAFTREDVTKCQVSYCGYFLVIKGSEVNLIHQSAKDYLLRGDRGTNPKLKDFRMEEQAGNLEIARKCLQYLEDSFLSSEGIDPTRETSPLEAFPLLSYATCYWHIHAGSLPRSDDIFDLSRPFYHKNSRIREFWLKTYCELTKDNSFRSSNLLYMASHFGILPLAEKLLKGFMNMAKRFRSINQKDEMGWTALHWAAGDGHLAIARLLIEKGANVNAKDRFDMTALHRAAYRGHEGLIRLLLDWGADINAKDKSGKTALHEAAWHGNEGVIRLLLKMGADINAKDKIGQTALYRAAMNKNEGVVRLLLEMGADIDAKDEDDMTALDYASYYEHEEVVQLLLRMGGVSTYVAPSSE